MSNTVEFLFDVGSPTTYLAHKRLPALIERTGAEVVYVPILLGGVFKATGNASPAMVPAKGLYMNADMARFARRHGIELVFNPHFPVNTLTMMRMIAGLVGHPLFMTLVDTLFNAMWRDQKSMGDPEVVATVLTEAGFDPEPMFALAQSDDAKALLIANTERAVARGVFGAPTFFVGDDMFFGQDRLVFVEEALEAA
jgi:2-hydroxychromene-2-carboxylate isomerase